MPSADVVVVGAGLAGLCAAEVTLRAGLETVVLEAADAVGGRVRTDEVDGFLLDRGFQLLNPAYPAVPRVFDVPKLQLQPFLPGVVVASSDGAHLLTDPRRSPGGAFSALSPATGSLREKLAFTRYCVAVATLPVSRLMRRPDVSYGVALDTAGVNGRLRQAVLEPFLAGVLGEDRQMTSRRFVDLLLRSFVRGTPALPAHGIQALPEQIASRLPTGTVFTDTLVRSVLGGTVEAEGGDWRARAVVVATDPVSAAALTDMPPPVMRGLTTVYFHAPTSPVADRRPRLHLDGDRRGPVLNTAVVSDAAPSYSQTGSLIAATVLGARQGTNLEREIARQLARIYRCSTRGWEVVAAYPIAEALPAMVPPLMLRQRVHLGDGLFVAGDHRDTASLQGALASGRCTGAAVVQDLRRDSARRH